MRTIGRVAAGIARLLPARGAARWIGAACVIFFFAVVAHLSALNNYYVLDDYRLIVRNPFITRWENASILFDPRYLFNPYPLRCGARPLTVFSLMVDYRVWGLNYFGYHLTNLFLHGLNAIMVMLLVRLLVRRCGTLSHAYMAMPGAVRALATRARAWLRSLGDTTAVRAVSAPGGAFFTAVIAGCAYALHPLQAEVVNIPSFRADQLVVLFYVLSLSSFILATSAATRQKTVGWYILTAGSFAAALFSKEMSLTLPAVCLVFMWETATRRLTVKQALSVLGLGVAGALFFLFFWKTRFFYHLFDIIFPNIRDNLSPLTSLTAYVSVIVRVFLHYMQTMFVPVGLSIDYLIEVPRTFVNLHNAAALLAGAGCVAAYLWTRDRLIRFGIAFWFIAYLPVSNLFPLVNTLNDRYMYLPIIGFIIVLAALVRRVSAPGRYALAAVIIVAYGGLTAARNPVFESAFTLYSEGFRRAPDNLRIRYNLGVAYMLREEYGPALQHLEAAFRLNPLFKTTDLWHLTGICYEELGDISAAERCYVKTLMIFPVKETLVNYVNILWRTKRQDTAIELLERCMSVSPDPFSYNVLGVFYADRKDYARAVAAFQASIDREPGYIDPWFNLFNAYHDWGKPELAERETYRMVAVYAKKGWKIDRRLVVQY